MILETSGRRATLWTAWFMFFLCAFISLGILLLVAIKNLIL